MTKFTKSNTYHLKWRFGDYPHIQISNGKERIVLNTKTGKIIKPTVCSYSVGYWISRKFITISKINDMVELIPDNEYCPF